MRYALTGSHGVGKTSIINGLEDFLIDKGIACLTNSSKARNVKKIGFDINDNASDASELLIASNHISNFSSDNWFADRCIIDTYAYAYYNLNEKKSITKETFDAIDYMAKTFIGLYSTIFYIPIEFKMVEDGIRKNDEEYRKKIDTIIKLNIMHHNSNVITLTGSIDERIEQVKAILL
jgi:thymidylate kinase